jgi:uncharacterized caspase-like protein
MRSVRELRDDHIKDGSLVVVFFSGHGVEHDGVNYLVPLGMPCGIKPQDYKEEAVSVDAIMENLSRFDAVVNIVLLDCCRQNELNTTFKAFKGLSDDGAKGLGKNFRNVRKSAEFFLGLACDPGTLAKPNKDARNSYYTAALLQHLPVAGRTLEESMKAVTENVLKDTKKEQRPWTNSCVVQHVVLVPE